VLVVAVTGGIGSGKSLVGEIFRELGAIVFDSDHLARLVVERGSEGFNQVVAHFGDEVLKDGQLDRAALAQIVFKDPLALKDLEAIIHPKVKALGDEIIKNAPKGSVVVNEIPLLAESGGKDRFDYIIAVESSEDLRIKRLAERGLKEYEARKRIAAQASDQERRAISHSVIENNGSREELIAQVERIWQEEITPRLKQKQ
jgi:dephospho-CoA kinase